MNARAARQVLRGYRPSGADDDEREVREALKVAKRTPDLEADFQNQLAFDHELAAVFDDDLPPELCAEIEETARRLEGGRPRRLTLRDPAMITVGLSFLVIIALVIWIFMGQMDSVAGMQEVVEMVENGNQGSADQFQAVEISAGALNDWFAMQSFEGFSVPRGMEAAAVLGARILKRDDAPVAVAVVAEPKALCYVFEAEKLGLSPREGKWKVVKYGAKDARAFAITRVGNMAFVLAPRGGGAEALQKYLDSLPATP
jgi:hypothetical protein